MSIQVADLLKPSTITGVAAVLINLSIRRIARRVKRHLTDVTALDFASAFVQALIYLFAFISFAHMVPALQSLGTALLAGVSVMSLAVGIAAQNTLGNIIAGFSLVLTRTIHVGDEVRLSSPVGVIAGKVRTISLSTTVLIDAAGMEVIVPNSVVMGSAITHAPKMQAQG